jgi:hypothetical protein
MTNFHAKWSVFKCGKEVLLYFGLFKQDYKTINLVKNSISQNVLIIREDHEILQNLL